MLYVRLRSSIVARKFVVALVCFFANTSQPAMGDDTVTGNYMLSDQEIAERCNASIQAKYDLVDGTYENGLARKVPRCVVTYEGMREVAGRYNEAQAQEASGIQGTGAGSCMGDNASQGNCLEAGAQVGMKAADAHHNLQNVADEGEQRLGEITGNMLAPQPAPNRDPASMPVASGTFLGQGEGGKTNYIPNDNTIIGGGQTPSAPYAGGANAIGQGR